MPISRLVSFAAGITLAAIWLATHRYGGIHHDALFYAVQAIARADPAAFRHDLFFAFGSQDDYSLFSAPYAWLVNALGLGRAAFALLVAAHLAWVLAAFAVARRWLHGAALWIALALVFGLPRDYGAWEIFHYAEGFLTARSWAEPLVLATVAATLAGRTALAIVACVAALLLHPIMALPALFFLAAWHGQPGWRTLALAAAIAAVAAAMLPAHYTMDGPWLEMVLRRAPFVLLDQWQWTELLEPLTWIGVLLAATAGANPTIRRACHALVLTEAVGLFLAALATLNHAAPLIQLQPWRVLWLLKIMAILALTEMFVRRWGNSAADRWLLAGIAAAAMTANTLGGPTALALAAIAHGAWRTSAAPVLPRWLPVAGTAALAVVLFEFMLAFVQQLGLVADRITFAWRGMPLGDLAALLDSPLALALPLGMWLLLRLAALLPRIAVGVAAIALITAASGWYRANDTLQEQLFARSPQRPFGDAIPRTATVYWQNNFLYSWFLLRQGNYASLQQSVGVVFSRQTALEAQRRLLRIAAFESGGGVARRGITSPTIHLAPSRSDLVELCRDPVLDFVILADKLGDGDTRAWQDFGSGNAWFLHGCEDFRIGPRAKTRLL